jgi:nucleoside 2-deoxyribosyltransferase
LPAERRWTLLPSPLAETEADVYEDLEAVAGLRIGRVMERVSKEHSEKLVHSNAEFASRGLAQSGPMQQARVELSISAAEGICREVANTWRELIVKRDRRLTQDSVRFIMSKVEAHAQSLIRSSMMAMKAAASPPDWAVGRLTHGIQGVVANIRRDLEIERREGELFPPDSTASSSGVFVIMAANRGLGPLYEQAIAPSVRENGLEPFLMVHREPRASISDEILSRIETAELIVADLSFERPNCYYEVGYAQAKGKKVLFTARRDHDPRRSNREPAAPKVHFDLDSHRISFWEDGEWATLRGELAQRVREALQVLKSPLSISDRLGERGESEVLTYFRKVQSEMTGQALLYDHVVAQELGWPLGDVRLVLKRLMEKGHIRPLASGYFLKDR